MKEIRGGRCLPFSRRQQVIEDGLRQGWTQDRIADECRCSRSTIYRQIREWRESGGFEGWLLDSWLELYAKLKAERPDIVFQNVTTLLSKYITRRMKVEGSTTIVVKHWGPEHE